MPRKEEWLKNPEACKARKKRYIEKYPEKYRESIRLAMRRWRQKNKEKSRWNFRQYANRKRSALGKHTFEEWLSILEIYGKKCAKCYSTEKITQDHKIPLSKGGTNNIDNIQPLCWSCNSRKNATVWFAQCSL
jgi:5-methylcytosine-specific restriction endonuclease McrA